MRRVQTFVKIEAMLRKYQVLGDYIKAERRRLGISQSELAGMVEITNSMLSMTESGKARPSPDTLDAIAVRLDIDANTLRKLAGYREIDSEAALSSLHASFANNASIDKPRPLVLQALRILLRLNDESLQVGVRQLQALESLNAADPKSTTTPESDVTDPELAPKRTRRSSR
jgi:transcriptional regulator with XRE-family HTH domain